MDSKNNKVKEGKAVSSLQKKHSPEERKKVKIPPVPRKKKMVFRAGDVQLAVSTFLIESGSQHQSVDRHLQALPSGPAREAFLRNYKTMLIGVLGMEPEVEAESTPQTITIAVGVINAVIAITPSSLLGINNLYDVFDEYRYMSHGIKVRYQPSITYGTLKADRLQVATGVIDYADAFALSSINQALAFETKKVFALETLNCPAHDLNLQVPTWDVELQLNDVLNWYVSGGTVTVPCWWKSYNFDTFLNGTNTTGAIRYTMRLKFRTYKSV